MSLRRFNPKRDAAEKPIVEALRAVGAEVWQLSGKGHPDLLVRYKGILTAAEVKTGKAKLRATQGQFPVWRDVDTALKAIGATK